MQLLTEKGFKGFGGMKMEEDSLNLLIFVPLSYALLSIFMSLSKLLHENAFDL